MYFIKFWTLKLWTWTTLKYNYLSVYKNILGCKPGRESNEWADYNFFGHQLVIHVDPNHNVKAHHNEVDGKSVPIPHFGVVIPWDDFDKFAKSLSVNKIQFTIEPYIRFEGLPGEQKTMFFYL